MRSSATQKQVKELVTRFPSLVENYSSNKLVAAYWEHIDGAKTIQHVAYYCASPEAITRAFRRLVTSGEIVLPEQVKNRNKQNEEGFKMEYSSCWK